MCARTYVPIRNLDKLKGIETFEIECINTYNILGGCEHALAHMACMVTHLILHIRV